MTKDDIIKLLNTNDKAIGRAPVVLTERQTESERNMQATVNANGVGFTPADAYMGTSMGNYYAKFGKLSEKQLAYWKKPNAKGVPRINKYAKQLLEHAIAKARKDERYHTKAEFAREEQAMEDDREMNKMIYEAEMRANGIYK